MTHSPSSELLHSHDAKHVHRWLHAIPKAELHLHLEGAIPLDALWTLVEKYGAPADVPNREALQTRFVYKDFPHFIRTWVWKNQFLREYEDFTFFSEAFARSLQEQNIIYAEVFCSPGDFTARHGLDTQRLLAAIRAGLQRVDGVRISLVVDMIRDFGPEKGRVVLEECAECASETGVIGVGIGGSEQAFPPEPWAEVYGRARELGLKTSAHAGEAAGPASIWGALDVLRVDRIGHGTRAVEDERLLDALEARGVPIELCPISNVCTGVIPSLESHPIRTFLERGIPVTVNTDDPAMFGNPMAYELFEVARVHGLTCADVEALVLSGVETSWMDDLVKEATRAEFYRGLGEARGLLTGVEI